ncbi:MAG: sodium:solute symporter, partial [Bacteroidota bacterium]
MTLFDWIVLVFYLGILVVVGIYFFQLNNSSESYTLGNHAIPGWVISLSIFATFVSSISYLALPATAYRDNWNSFAFSLSLPIAAVIALRFFVPLFRKVNSPSAYTLLSIHYGPWARNYASVMYLLTQVMRTGTILYLMALLTQSLFGWNVVVVIVATSLTIVVYSLAGGIRAVVWTDAIQAIILIAGAIVCLIIISMKIPGGVAEIVTSGMEHGKFSIGEIGPELFKPTFWVVLIYGLFINLQNFGADQNYIQRYLSSQSLQAARRSAWQGAMLYIPVSALFLLIGTGLFVLYRSGASTLPASLLDPANADAVFPHFIVTELPDGVRGLLVVSIFSAGMSTISTSYNSGATVMLNDFYLPIAGNEIVEHRRLRVLYASTMLIACSGAAVAVAMISTKSALDTWWKLASVFSGGILGLFLLVLIPGTRSKSAAVAGVCAAVLVILAMTVSSLVLPAGSEWNLFHPYLSIVFGTTALVITALVAGS